MLKIYKKYENKNYSQTSLDWDNMQSQDDAKLIPLDEFDNGLPF